MHDRSTRDFVHDLPRIRAGAIEHRIRVRAGTVGFLLGMLASFGAAAMFAPAAPRPAAEPLPAAVTALELVHADVDGDSAP